MSRSSKKVHVELGERSYDIHIGHQTLSDLGQALGPFGFSRKAAIISNPTVFDLYGPQVCQSLQQAGFQVIPALMQDGEQYKNLETVSALWDQLLAQRLDRQCPVIALGGGVVGDVAGFVAATYMRGIPYIQVPTTLLAQVDSSVGGKTGIDHAEGKNLIGCFYQPRLVWIDTATLKTLERRELRCGLAEVIKYGVIADRSLFEFLESRIDDILALSEEPLGFVVQRCCEIKADVVCRDERESGLRAILNFGHTVGHAIEALASYQTLKHGEAISMGMIAETALAVRLGLAGTEILNQLENLLRRAGLPTRIPKESDLKHLIHLMTADKKARQGSIRLVLPREIGRVELPQPVSPEQIKRALQESTR